jgi:ATP-dependent RNA helicase RhlE
MDALRQMNITDCTPIQESTIPLVLDGKDISGLSQTGTGKTFAFLLPLVERILRTKKKLAENPTELDIKRGFDSWNSGHFILILAPTRELADQINKAVTTVCNQTGLKSALVYGGVEYEAQTSALKGGVDIVVGTPGRLLDLYKNHHIDFKQAKAIVFDEADRMFDMGFKDDMVYILQRVPQDRQILLFSATLNFDVMNTIYRFDSNPVEINVSRDQAKAGDVTDELFHVGENDKPQYLLSLITRFKPKQTIIFSNFKMNVDRITQFLSNNGVPAVGISSLLTQGQRERVLEQFKNENERNTLVATDVAARGLDIKGVDLVINYDLPDDAENYVHRIGRTGRAGAKGHAISLVSDRDVMALSRIEGYMKTKITIGWLEDADIVKDFKSLPRDNYRGESRVKKTGLAAMKAQIPQGQQDRPPRDGDNRNNNRRFDNRDNRNDNRPPREGGGQDTHRDRKSGRHQNPNNPNRDNRDSRDQRPNGPANGPARPQHNANRPQQGRPNQPRHNTNTNRPNNSSAKPAPNKSFRANSNNAGLNKNVDRNKSQKSFKSKSSNTVSQKVKTFFKNLFR